MSDDYQRVNFDADGNVIGPPDAGAVIAEIVASGTADLFVFSHGWGNSTADAESLYSAMFPLIRAAGGCPADAQFLGIFWPSIWFPEPPTTGQPPEAAITATDAAPDAVTAPPPGVSDAGVSGGEIAATLAAAMPQHADALTTMGSLVDAGLAGVATGTGHAIQAGDVQQFHTLLRKVFSQQSLPPEDGGEGPLFATPDPVTVYQRLSQEMGSAPPAGDAEGLGDVFGSVWNGAKDALRVGSYFEMKARAGVIGQRGLGPLLEQLHTEAPTVRVHLVGHSFGARLVSFALAGISQPERSPVGSLTLVQGAFSHWAFTPTNPWGNAGALCTVNDRVHGPLVATFTTADWAVGNWYPKASFLSQQDVQDETQPGQWDGMGKDGYQNVTPQSDLTLPLPPDTALAANTFYRVDANAVIRDTSQSAFAGAHSDIRHPEVGALIVAAATAGR